MSEQTWWMLILIFQACAHTFFDELREPGTKLPHMRDLPPLFNFTQSELKIQPALNSQLIPAHMAAQVAAQAAAGTAGMHTIIALSPLNEMFDLYKTFFWKNF